MGSSYYGLFCLAPNLSSKINELLQYAQTNTTAGNVFCLIQSPSQSSVEKPTAPPVSDFETGFQDWSIEQIGDWCKEKFNWNNPKSQPPYIAAGEFAVMDERTLQDGTVLLVKYDVWTERIDPNDPSDADEAFKQHEGYRRVRCFVKGAPDLMESLGELNLSELLASMRSEDQGVLKTET